MGTLSSRRPLALASLLALPLLGGCGQKSPAPSASVPVTPLTHRGFPIATGPHAVSCTACHGDYPPPSQIDCVGCHTSGPTDPVHTTTTGYLFESRACLSCHRDPTSHPFDHQGIALCASCHRAGAFYAALPVAGFAHPAFGDSDCSACHAVATWLNASAPLGILADPAAAVTVNALIATTSGTTIVALSPQAETLPMGMDHATTAVNMGGLACTVCHASAGAGVYFPGRLHSPLATRAQPPPISCRDCHATSAPTGFVGPTAVSPPRNPPSGEMKHDAVAWAGGAATTIRLVTADCGSCHVGPAAGLAATWGTSRSGSSPVEYHAALVAAGLPQPASCVDCHANTRPIGDVSAGATSLLAGISYDHAAAGAMGDCAACHDGPTTWANGRHHLSGSSTPTSCLPCHAAQRPTSSSGWVGAGYTASPFDYGTNSAGITHGDGLDCAGCHTGPGTGGAWGGAQAFTGGRFTHGPSSVAAVTCSACHLSQRPDRVLGSAAAAAALSGFDHSVSGTGDCLGCHQATVTAARYVDYFAPGGSLPGGDWKGADAYPGNGLVSSPSQAMSLVEYFLYRPTPGSLVTGLTFVQDTLQNAIRHTAAAVPAELNPGPAGAPDLGSCWHCHKHDATGAVTSFADGSFHPSLAAYSLTVGGAVTPLPEPSRCAECHALAAPPGIVELRLSPLQAMDHGAAFAAAVTIGGQLVGGVAAMDCSSCHQRPGATWSDGRFHASIGTAVPADCVTCHYPLMAFAPFADLTLGASYAMSHLSRQLPIQSCETCHASALAGSTATVSRPEAWSPGTFHANLAAQPTACIDCHAISAPSAASPTQSSWTYQLSAGATNSNGGQWMNHGSAAAAGLDCGACHAADARRSGSAWSRSAELHVAAPWPATCQECHGLGNGNAGGAGIGNNLPAGLTSSTTLTSAAADPATGVPKGTHDQITHADVNVASQDCGVCHVQVGRSTVAGVQGAEWAQASFHASFSAASPLLLDGITGRCSNCHLNVKPVASFTIKDHGGFTDVAGTQDCSACHSWPGMGGVSAPDWLGASDTPQFITVGGFPVPQPPATAATIQPGVASLPHPTATDPTSCATCHVGGTGAKGAVGYDHASPVGAAACSACHEAGSNLVGTAWNGAATEGAGAGDTRPWTLASVVAQRGGLGGDSCTVTVPSHFHPVQCGECHAVPAGTGAVTTGAAYAAAWYFPHQTTSMTNPGTCLLCHDVPTCPGVP